MSEIYSILSVPFSKLYFLSLEGEDVLILGKNLFNKLLLTHFMMSSAVFRVTEHTST
jgi:hypothetical protein